MPLNCKSARVYGLVRVWKIDDRKRKKQEQNKIREAMISPALFSSNKT